MIISGCNFIGIVVLYNASVLSCSKRLKSIFTTSKYLDMHHVVLLNLDIRVKVLPAVKNQVTGLHLLKFQIDWQSVIKVCLIPSADLEPEVKA